MHRDTSESMTAPSARSVLLVALLALAIRLLYWVEHQQSAFFAVPLLDARYYDLVARTWLAGGDLTVFGGFRPMLYPGFLALGYLAGGPALGIPVVLFAQHLLGVLTAVLVTLTGARVARCPRSGLTAGVLYALASPPLFFEGELLIAPVLTFLLTASMLAAVMAIGRRGPRAWAAWACSGVFAGLAVQARPDVLVWYPAAAAVGLAAALGRRGALAAGCAVWLAAAATTLLPFGRVNALQTGRYQLMTHAGGINFYVGNRRGADGMTPVQDRSVAYAGAYDDSLRVYADQEYRRANGLRPGGPAPDGAEVSRYWMRRGMQEVAAAPARWLALMARKCWFMVWNREIANNETFSFILSHESRLLRVLPVRWWLLVALAPLGALAVARRGHRGALLWMSALSAAYAAGIVLFFVTSRYRIALWPAACVLAGAALAQGWRAGLAPPAARAAACAAGVALAALSLYNWLGMPPESYARDFFFRSKARLVKGDAAGAAEDIERSLQLDPANPDARFHLASVQFAGGRLEQARTTLVEYTRRWPDDPQAWSNLGVISHRLNRNAEAHEAAMKTLARDPRNANALLTAGMLALRSGEVEDARRMLVQVTGAGDRADVLAAHSRLAEHENSPEKARALAARAAEVDPTLAAETFGLLNTPLPPADRDRIRQEQATP